MKREELEAIKRRVEAATPWEEEWRVLEKYPDYEISNFGRVRTKLRKGNHKQKCGQKYRLLKLVTSPRGYQSVSLPINGSYRHCRIHTLVMVAFCGPRPSGLETAHLNGDPSDNRLSNLIYCTHRENESHKKLHGTNLGQRNSNAKLLGWQVAEIKYLASRAIPQGKIAELFGISHKDVSQILCGRTWKDISARTDVPALVAEVERLRDALLSMKDCFNEKQIREALEE
jgi:hypothetical protein